MKAKVHPWRLTLLATLFHPAPAGPGRPDLERHRNNQWIVGANWSGIVCRARRLRHLQQPLHGQPKQLAGAGLHDSGSRGQQRAGGGFHRRRQHAHADADDHLITRTWSAHDQPHAAGHRHGQRHAEPGDFRAGGAGQPTRPGSSPTARLSTFPAPSREVCRPLQGWPRRALPRGDEHFFHRRFHRQRRPGLDQQQRRPRRRGQDQEFWFANNALGAGLHLNGTNGNISLPGVVQFNVSQHTARFSTKPATTLSTATCTSSRAVAWPMLWPMPGA